VVRLSSCVLCEDLRIIFLLVNCTNDFLIFDVIGFDVCIDLFNKFI
jgi:hypothetical protein